MAAFDDVYQALGASFVPEELTGNPRVAPGRGPGGRASGIGAVRLRQAARGWLAVGLASLARGNVTAARRLFGRGRQRRAPRIPPRHCWPRWLTLLAVQTGYAFLPGGGIELLPHARRRAGRTSFETTRGATLIPAAGRPVPRSGGRRMVTLLGEVIPGGAACSGPDFQTGRLVSPDRGRAPGVAGVRQACDRLAAEADAAAWPTLAAFARRTPAELALRLGDRPGLRSCRRPPTPTWPPGSRAGQAACVLAGGRVAARSAQRTGEPWTPRSWNRPKATARFRPDTRQLEMQRFGADTGPAVSLAAQAAESSPRSGPDAGWPRWRCTGATRPSAAAASPTSRHSRW